MDKLFKKDSGTREMRWKIFRRPAQKKASTKIILVPNPQNVERNPMPGNQNIANLNPANHITPMGNPNYGNQNIEGRNLNPGSGTLDVEKGKKSRETLQFGSWQTSISNSCLTCLIIWLIIMAILTLVSLGFSIFALVVFFYNGDAEGNWNYLTAPDPDDYVDDISSY